MRDEEESLPVGSKVPQPMVSRPVYSWLFKPTSSLSFEDLCGDCLEAVPVPAMHAAPSARLLCVVSSAQGFDSWGLADRSVIGSKLGSV